MLEFEHNLISYLKKLFQEENYFVAISAVKMNNLKSSNYSYDYLITKIKKSKMLVLFDKYSDNRVVLKFTNMYKIKKAF